MEAASTLPGPKDLFPEHFYRRRQQQQQEQQQQGLKQEQQQQQQQQQQHSNPTSPSQPKLAVSQSPSLSQSSLTSQQQTLPSQQQQPSASRDTSQRFHPHHISSQPIQEPSSSVLPIHMSFQNSYSHLAPPPHHAESRGSRRAYEGQQYIFAPEMGVAPGIGQSQDPNALGVGIQLGLGPGAPGVPLGMSMGALPPRGVRGEDDGIDEGDDGDDGDASMIAEKRRHPCPQCGKRFNRPSSLKIHLNTHTGAKPFLCPYPGCGRSFNVSSNMRRHYRNHARRPAPPPLPAAYPISYVKPTRGRPPQSGDQAPEQEFQQQHIMEHHGAYAQQTVYDIGGAVMHPQLYPRRSDMRTRTGGGTMSASSGDAGGSSRQRASGNHPPTPPYTEESELGAAECEREEEGDRVYGPSHGDPQRMRYVIAGSAQGGEDVLNERGAPPGYHAPYPGFCAGPSGPMYPAHLPPQAHGRGHQGMIPMAVPLEMAFPVDPALNGNAEQDADADAEGEADPDADIDVNDDNDREENDASMDENVRDDDGTKKTESRRKANSKARGHANSHAPPAPHPGLQFRQILVPVGDPTQMQQHYAHYQAHYAPYGYPVPIPVPVSGDLNPNVNMGIGVTMPQGPNGVGVASSPYPAQGYVAYPAVYAYPPPQQRTPRAHATSAVRSSNSPVKGKIVSRTPSKKDGKEHEPDMEQDKDRGKDRDDEKEKPNLRTLPQSNARSTRESVTATSSSVSATAAGPAASRQSVSANSTHTGGSNEGMTPGAAPVPPYPIYTYPPPPQPDLDGAGANLDETQDDEEEGRSTQPEETKDKLNVKTKRKVGRPKKGGKNNGTSVSTGSTPTPSSVGLNTRGKERGATVASGTEAEVTGSKRLRKTTNAMGKGATPSPHVETEPEAEEDDMGAEDAVKSMRLRKRPNVNVISNGTGGIRGGRRKARIRT